MILGMLPRRERRALQRALKPFKSTACTLDKAAAYDPGVGPFTVDCVCGTRTLVVTTAARFRSRPQLRACTDCGTVSGPKALPGGKPE